MKISKLLGNVTEYTKNVPNGIYCNQDRCTGRSTAQVLRVISEAMQYPNKMIHIVDRSNPESTKYSEGVFTKTVQRTIEKLGLKYLDVVSGRRGYKRNQLVYNIYGNYSERSRIVTEGVEEEDDL